MIDPIARGRLNHVSLAIELRVIAKLLHRYADTPMDFADACVVRLAELHKDAAVCTTDSLFRIFRQHQRNSISLIAPFCP